MNERVRKALEARKIRPSGSDSVKKALEHREQNIRKNLPTATSDLDTRYKNIVNSYAEFEGKASKVASSPFGSKEYHSLQTDKSAADKYIDSLRNDLNRYKKYLGADKVDKYIKNLDSMQKRYADVVGDTSSFKDVVTNMPYKWNDTAITPVDVIKRKYEEQYEATKPLRLALDGLPDNPTYADISARRSSLERQKNSAKQLGKDTSEFDSQLNALASYTDHNRDIIDTMTEDEIRETIGQGVKVKDVLSEDEKEKYHWLASYNNGDVIAKSREDGENNKKIAQQYGQYFNEKYGIKPEEVTLNSLTNNATKTKEGEIAYYDTTGKAVTWREVLIINKQEDDIRKMNADETLKFFYDEIERNEKVIDEINRDIAVINNNTITLNNTVRNTKEVNDVLNKYGLSGVNSPSTIIDNIEAKKTHPEDQYSHYYESLLDAGIDYHDFKIYRQYLKDKEEYIKRKEKTEKYATKNALNATLATASSVLTAPSQVLDLALNLGEAAGSIGRSDTSAYRLTNPYNDVNVNRITTQTGTVSNLINKKVVDSTNSEALGWLASSGYSGATSAAQSAATTAVSMAIFGPEAGPAIGLGILASEAASSGFNQTAMNGGTYGEAVTTAVANGVAEAVFEKVSLDSFIKLGKGMRAKSWKEFFKNTTKNSKNVLVHSLIESSEELMTEMSNSVSDDVINGDHSNYNVAVDKYIQGGMPEEEAKIQASKDVFSQIAQAAIGGLIGGLSAGGTRAVTNTVGDAYQLGHNNHIYKTTGKKIIESGRDKILIDEAAHLRKTSQNEQTVKLAEELIGKDVSKLSKSELREYTKNLGKLHVMMYGDATLNNLVAESAIKNVIKRQLIENGVTEQVDEVTDAVFKKFSGEKLTDAENILVETNRGNDVISYINANREQVGNVVLDTYDITRQRLQHIEEYTKEAEERDIDIEDYEFSDDGKTYIANTDKAVNVVEIQSVKEDDVLVTLSDGSTESVKNLDLGKVDDAIIYQGIVDIQKFLGVKLDSDTANKIVDEFRKNGGNASSFITEAKLALSHGYARVKMGKTFNLSPSSVNAIYSLGLELRENEDNRKEVDKKNVGSQARSVVYEGIDKKSLTERQRVSAEAMEKISEITGVSVVFYRSKKVNGKWTSKYDTKNGSPNGFYDGDTNTIYLDVNSGLSGKGTVLFTASHELTHFIRKHSSKQFKVFADFLMEKYAEHNIDVNTLIRDKMHKLGLSYDAAYEEVVADSCESFLIDANLETRLQELAQKDKGLIQRIVEFFKNFLQKIKDAYAGLTPESQEGRLVREMHDSIEELHNKFFEALKAATENSKKAEVNTTKNTAKNDGVRFSYAGREAVNSDISLLQKAQSMIESGVDSESVRKETGWFKGYDNKWRFEIDDSEMEFHFDGLNKNPDVLRFKELQNKFINADITDAEMNEMNTLKEALKGVNIKLKTISDRVVHNKLFKAYPQLKDIKLVFDTLDKNTKGEYSYQNKTITLNNNLIGNNEEIRKTLIHEIQHTIQDIEGFAAGASVEYWKNQRKEINELIGGARANLDLWLDDIGYNEFVKKSMQEVVSKEKTLEQHWEDCRRFKDNSKFAKQIANCEAEIAEYERQRKEITKGMNVVDQYFNTAGEIEARDTENRLNLSEKQRKNTRPDIDRTSVAFADGDVSSSIGYTTQNEPVVVVNDDIIFNAFSNKDIIKIVKQSIGKFKRIPINGQTIHFISDTKSEYVGSKYTQWLNRNDKQKYEDKMRVAGHPHDIVYATTNYVNEGLKHPRKDNIVDFARGEILIDVSGRQYTAEVVIGFTKKGICELHDVVNMKDTVFEYKKEAIPKGMDSKESTRSGITSNSMIPQGDSTVNNNYMQNEDRNEDGNEERNSLRDNEYLEAVKNGDMETAQRMVDEAALAKGVRTDIDGNPETLYHSTDNNFNAFDYDMFTMGTYGLGIYVTPSKAKSIKYGKITMSGYLFSKKLATFGERNIKSDKVLEFLEIFKVSENDIKRQFSYMIGNKKLDDYIKSSNDFMILLNLQYWVLENSKVETSLLLKSMKECFGYDGLEIDNEVILWDNSLFKSADPVTYDDNGDVIPLSKRFDVENEDIRYQARPDFDDFIFDDFDGEVTDNDARLMTEYLRQGKTDIVRHLINQTRNIEIADGKIRTLVSRLMKSYGLDNYYNKDIAISVMSLLESTNRNEVDENLEMLQDALLKAVKKSEYVSEYDREFRDELNEFLKDYRKEYAVYLNDEQISSLEFQGRSVKWLRSKLAGVVDIVREDADTKKKKMSFGYFWHHMAEHFPERFSMDHVDAVDNWEMFIENMDKINHPEDIGVENAYGMSENEFVSELSARMVADIVENKYNSKKNAYVADLVKMLRRKHNEKVKSARAKERKRVKNLEHTRYEKIELKQKIKRMELNKRKSLTNPNRSRFIPRDLISQTVDVLKAINLDSGRSVRLSQEIALLRSKYDSLKNNAQYYAAYDDTVSSMLNTLTEKIGDTPISKMTVEQLRLTYNTLKALDTAVRESVKLTETNEKKSVYEFGQELISETKAIPKSQDGFLKKYLMTQQSPETFFESMGGFKKNSYWSKLYNILNDGQLKKTRLTMEFTKTFSELIEDTKGLKSLQDTKNTIDIGLVDENGDAVKVTRGMMLSVYMHLANEDNANHIARGGFTAPNIKEYYNGKISKAFGSKQKAVRGYSMEFSQIYRELQRTSNELRNTELTESHRAELENEVKILQEKYNTMAEKADQYLDGLRARIEKQLTDYDKKWLIVAHYFFDEQTKSEINKVSMLMHGFEKAVVENYYPIHTDSNYRTASFEEIVRDFSLENSGFMKDRMKGASNPILLEDITDVVMSYIDQVSKYCGMTIPIKNFQKVYGTTTQGYETSVQKELSLKFSENAQKYISNLLTDLTTTRSLNDTFSKIINFFRSGLAKSVLPINLRVAMAQAASYPTAAAEIGWEPLLKALAKGGKNNAVISRADKELIAKWSPLLWYRMQGYSTTEIGDLKNERSKRAVAEKKMRWLFGWIQATDGATVGRLWYASEYYIQDKHPKLEKGTDKYYEEVAKVFNKVVEKTQPNYTTMQRPDILRNPNAVLKTLTMFMTQRLQNYNIVYRACGRYNKYLKDYRAGNNGVTFEDVKTARTDLIRAVTSQIVSSLILNAMRVLADMLTHSMWGYTDDDDELTAESVSTHIIDMFVDTVIGNFAFGTDLYSAGKIAYNKIFGDGKQSYQGLSMNGVDSFVEAVDMVLTTLGDLSLENCNDLAIAVCQLLGIPLGNAEKIGAAFYYHYKDISNGEFLSTESNTKQIKVENYSEAYEDGDTEKANIILEDMIGKKYNEHYIKGDTEEDAMKNARSDVRASFTREYKDLYLDAFYNGRTQEAAKIRQMLYATGLYGTLTEFDKDIAKWKETYREEQEKAKRAEQRAK